jgi:hypothetical protein
VGEWLACVAEYSEANTSELLSRAAAISPVLYDVMEKAGFQGSWENLQKNNREGAKLMAAFHGWFDAFRTMRLIHELSDQAYPRIAPEGAVTPLLVRAGQVIPDTAAGQLELLRRMQGAG